jgi:hypothetical protein
MVEESTAAASIVLNDQSRTDLSSYGFRSWMLQEIDQPYEVIVNVFNDRRGVFEKLSEGKNPNCKVIINTYDPPEVFNISAANDLGLHFATGKYVLFANADIIHPSAYLRTVAGEMHKRDLHYLIGMRANLTKERTAALPPAASVTREKNFDFLNGVEFLNELPRGVGMSPWVGNRESLFAVGGFDPNVYCHEDEELNDRMMHYLRRTGKQPTLYCMFDAMAYHLDHKPSELHAMGPASRKIIGPRRERLLKDPASTEDVVPTPLHSLPALREILAKSSRPEIPVNKAVREIMPWRMRVALNRMKKANRLLWTGHL